MRKIQLTQNKVALIDNEDYTKVSQYKWYATKSNSGFRVRRTIVHNVKQDMSRFLLGIKDSKILVDHINRNPLDNRRSNLRVANKRQNVGNCKMFKHNTSGYRGVSKCYSTRKGDKWLASIIINGKQKQLGRFDNKIDAAKTYDKAAKKHFGEFAYLNFKEKK